MPNTDEYFVPNQWHHFPDSGEAWHKPDAFFRLNPLQDHDQQLG